MLDTDSSQSGVNVVNGFKLDVNALVRDHPWWLAFIIMGVAFIVTLPKLIEAVSALIVNKSKAIDDMKEARSKIANQLGRDKHSGKFGKIK